ncbi:MAG: long-chain-fatty-acid--CoA ligase [Elusimicrobiota bacterium]
MPDYIYNSAKRYPDQIAFIFRDQKITYSELADKISRCANGLLKLGVKKNDTFVVCLRNSPEFIIFSMALSKIGGILVPVNFLEKAERIALIIKDSKAVGILTAKEFYSAAVEACKGLSHVKFFYLREGSHKDFLNINEILQSDPYEGPDLSHEDDLMMLLYTSGTTGLPKGVMLTHKNFIANVEQSLKAIAVGEKDRFLCLLPLFHSFSWTTCMMLPLKLGAQVVIVESLLPFDPVIKMIWKYKVTCFLAIPQIFSALTNKIDGFKAIVLRFLSPVKICISGAAPMPQGIHESFEKKFGVKLLEGYGLTEASPVVSLNPFSKRKIGTVGKPIPGVLVDIRTDEGKTLPLGEVGEIWVKGENVMKGYFNRPEETAEVLTSDGWLKTGDMGKLDDEGYLQIVDRKKDLIIIKGLNVYPQDIENVISKYDAVKEVAVVGKMDKETGDETIRAFVTAKENMAIDKSYIMTLCRDHLAPYKRPKEIILLDEMPKNALQKILKKDLRNR